MIEIAANQKVRLPSTKFSRYVHALLIEIGTSIAFDQGRREILIGSPTDVCDVTELEYDPKSLKRAASMSTWQGQGCHQCLPARPDVLQP
jgi:hypothetical protein